MKNKDLNKSLVSILTTPLRICEDKARPILMAYSCFLDSAKTGDIEEQLKENIENNKISLASVKHNNSEDFENFKAEVDMRITDVSTFKDATPGSILIVPVRGVMMRETQYSWSYGYVTGTRELEKTIKAAEQSPNIAAVVVQLKSPGGEAAGNESLARVIKNCNIPVLISFEGMASAALEAFIGADEIYALEKDSYFGSLGTLTSIVDDSKFWDEMGVKFTDIYAPQSTLKNVEYRAALEGDNKPMEDRLEASTEFFIKDVKAARPQIVDDGKIYKGAIYNAVEALKIKAIDGIKDFDFVINRAAFLSRKNARENNANKMTPEEKLAAEKAASEKETVEVSKEDKGLLDQIKGFLGIGKKEAGSEIPNEISKANEELGKLKAQLGSLEKSLAEYAVEKASLQNEISKLTADREQLKNAKVLDGENPFESVEALVKTYNQTFEHNKELGGDGKAPNLPVSNKETEDVLQPAKTAEPAKTADQREREIEQKLKEKRAAKEAAKTENK